jgi:hypothetical protein
MTRMWMTDPTVMCNEHLQREHWEIHQLVEQMRGDWDMPAYDQTMKVFGHAVRGQVFPTRIDNRHARLVQEMEQRGITHDSELLPHTSIANVFRSSSVTEALIKHNTRELARRCDKCKDRQDI